MKLYVRIIHQKSAIKEIERLQNSGKYKYYKFTLDEFTEIDVYISEYQIFYKIPHEYGFNLIIIVPEKPFDNINIRELFEQVFERLPPNPLYSDEDTSEESKQFWEGEKEIIIEV